ncbi:hypothetical protein CNMCM6936_002682 [Aspergillus lentulus]|nr:hypothetical protein CNMCM6069_002417 [Aspergillus lentulus]KAF4162034.1 hypothetical protein CNMCM6936_002682 [Aspergillus lentulus]KAF4191725.1 hypothetical protein CNMCM8694_001398 [Aspergillus lentulus]
MPTTAIPVLASPRGHPPAPMRHPGTRWLPSWASGHGTQPASDSSSGPPAASSPPPTRGRPTTHGRKTMCPSEDLVRDVTVSRRGDYLNMGDDGGDVQAFRVRPCSCVGSANNPAADNPRPPPPPSNTSHTTADTTRATHGTMGRAGGKEAMNPAPDKRGSTSSKSSTGSGSVFHTAGSLSLHIVQGLRHRRGRSPGRHDSAPADGWDDKKGGLLPRPSASDVCQRSQVLQHLLKTTLQQVSGALVNDDCI